MQSPISSKALAHLFLYAVLPAFSELVRLDPEARERMTPWNITLSMGIIRKNAVTLHIKNGDMIFYPNCLTKTDVTFLFLSEKHLNAFFNGNPWALPLVTRGLWRIRFLSDFSKLAKRLNLFLEDNTSKCPIYTQLAFFIGGLGLVSLATLDSFSIALLKKLPPGLAEFSIEHPSIPPLWFEHDQASVRAGQGPPPRKPDVRLRFTTLEIANGAIRNDIDTMAAIGAQRICVEGLTPLAEGLGVMMERLQVYLERPHTGFQTSSISVIRL
ncbi:MAG: hypothetical protein NTW94_01650 [Legionellales bacterium]|nr:hypothetical protein [Legionellales bacterium]